MKIFKLFLFTAFISLTISCSSDDDSSSAANNDNIVGVWKGTEVNYTGVQTSVANGETTTMEFVGTGYDLDYTITITANPNNITSEGSYKVELVTTIDGQTNTVNLEDINFLETSTWSIDGDQFSLTSNGDTDVMTIVELTDSNLVLNGISVETLSQGGVQMESTTDITLKFSKL
ncbi:MULTISPECIES: lipocalin family protein [Aequorivita]|uniref:Lipocalin family protein n=2 Tax=Aequorivita TaxID=153265 RepID=A0AB35YV22_9FLAO|nr:lipocalin family protein [Aequorivita sp. Ant34-E75]WGF92942.1 lipocalin family protein [Aequorivita sp. Ant34-E75]